MNVERREVGRAMEQTEEERERESERGYIEEKISTVREKKKKEI